MSKEVVVHKHSSQSRPYVSFTRKYNLGNYESLDVSVGLSDDCSEAETVEDGFERISKTVEEQLARLCEKIEGKHRGGKK